MERRGKRGLPITGDYEIRLPDGTRGNIWKCGRRWHIQLPDSVKIVPRAARIKRRRAKT